MASAESKDPVNGAVSLPKAALRGPVAIEERLGSGAACEYRERGTLIRNSWCEGGDSNPYTIAGVRT